jgi:hypothetical protein
VRPLVSCESPSDVGRIVMRSGVRVTVEEITGSCLSAMT